MSITAEKPHIKKSFLHHLPRWVCMSSGKYAGVGVTPQMAYRHWVIKNWQHAEQETTTRPVVDSGRIIAGVLALAIIVAGIISAVMLWDAA